MTATAVRPKQSASALSMNALRRIVRALRQADAKSRSDGGLPSAQLFVMRQLRSKESLSIRDLCDATLTSQSSVSEVVARLETKGLVKHLRSDDDNRRAEVSLTTAGRKVLENSETPFQEKLVKALNRMSKKDQDTLARLMNEWLVEAGIADQPATMFFEP